MSNTPKGKAGLMTGASRGLGAATALALADQAAATLQVCGGCL